MWQPLSLASKGKVGLRRTLIWVGLSQISHLKQCISIRYPHLIKYGTDKARSKDGIALWASLFQDRMSNKPGKLTNIILPPATEQTHNPWWLSSQTFAAGQRGWLSTGPSPGEKQHRVHSLLTGVQKHHPHMWETAHLSNVLYWTESVRRCSEAKAYWRVDVRKRLSWRREGEAKDINGCITDHIGMSGSPGKGCLRINCV